MDAQLNPQTIPPEEVKKPTTDKKKALDQLTEIVLDYIGIPRPGTADYVKTLQDELLPDFIASARLAWLASTPYPGNDAQALGALRMALESNSGQISSLNAILAGLGIHELLEAVASSPAAPYIADLPVELYEVRLLRAVGKCADEQMVRDYLDYATSHPQLLKTSEQILAEASEVTMKAHTQNFNININVQPPPPPPVKNQPRRKSIAGTGKVLEGVLLLAGNGCLVPAVPMFVLSALPVLASFASGIGAVGEGLGQMRGE